MNMTKTNIIKIHEQEDCIVATHKISIINAKHSVARWSGVSGFPSVIEREL